MLEQKKHIQEQITHRSEQEQHMARKTFSGGCRVEMK